ncbi:phosphoribosylglycinamide formyltransferase [Gimibacter soli]|uniref:Phosphoribosylglycinamide formyltransferase n=1 Tax=Gimibacter soli TaxID=3024400 RepID=A0AAE9XML0_9PROT|nr:phosphoribosylglycinamide formyltransferase [Gimibacter soli]WCL52807.1 phosphoribosylglycinamide formyltransferase [Gimibacter soli]
MAKLKLGVLISGSGTNLQVLIDACARADYPAEIALVISNKAAAGGIARAEAAGIPVATISHKDFDCREAFDDAMHEKLTEAGAEFICLAGFMRILSDKFIERWHDRMINIHPSLLPAYRGLDTHARAIADGVRFAGCTLHYVRPDLDNGPIIAQAVVPVLPGDTVETLAARIQVQEHRLYPAIVRLIAEGKVMVEDGRVVYGDGVELNISAATSPAIN